MSWLWLRSYTAFNSRISRSLAPTGTCDQPCWLAQACEGFLLLQVRSIELAGQGSKAVVYTARLVGHPDFSLEASTIRVEPGATASLAVQCKASTTNPQVWQPDIYRPHNAC